MGAALVAFRRCKNLQRKECLTKGLPRVLGVLDLVFLGVGSTLGGGVYVVVGEIARTKSGPGVVLSFFFAAIAALLCGLCYAEFGARIPKAGSAYVYAYATIGELAGFMVGWNLIIEYLIGAAAVARAWSSYLDSLTDNEISTGIQELIAHWKTPGISPYPDFFSFLLCLVSMLLLVLGVRLSCWFNMGMTIINTIVVVFTILLGLMLMRPSNWVPFLSNGFTGALGGAGPAMFAFVGFDVIATAAEESKDPARSIPLSIFITIGTCLIAYAGIGMMLTLLIPFADLKIHAPLAEAFQQRGVGWMKYIIASGAIAGLAASTISNMLPVSRLLYSMADDGLLFPFLANVNKTTKTPAFATLITGVIASFLAFFFDLSNLVEMLTMSTFQAYASVAVCVLLSRYKIHPIGMVATDKGFEPISNESFVSEKERIQMFPTKRSYKLVLSATTVIVIASLGMAFLLANHGVQILHGYFWTIVFFFFFFGLIVVAMTVICLQPQNKFELPFRAPFVPFLPAVSILISATVMMSLSLLTWTRFGVWITLGRWYTSCLVNKFSVGASSDGLIVSLSIAGVCCTI